MRKSVTRTLRIDEVLDRSIQRIATDENLTVNSLVNRTLTKMIEWDRPAEKVGFVSASPTLMGRLLSERDGEASEELGRWAAREVFLPFIQYLFGEVSVTTVLLYFKRASGYGQFAFDETGDSGKRILILKQSLGPNWTLYYDGVMKEIFNETMGKELATECTSDMLVGKLATS